MTEKHRFIFLDIDGVLNSMPYFENIRESKKNGKNEISKEHLGRLARLCHSTNSKIVLSSSWRLLKDAHDGEDGAEGMYQYLTDSLFEYGLSIYDVTKNIGMDRPLEIREWLRENREEGSRFISLDDDFSLEDYEKHGIGKCLVHTDFFCAYEDEGGMQEVHMERGRKILEGDFPLITEL